MGVVLSKETLTGALLAALAVRVTTGTKARPGRAGAPIRHRANSAFGAAARVLDLFEAVDYPQGNSGPVLRQDAHALAASITDADDPRISCLIQSFLSVACYYDNLPSSLSWFRAPEPYRKAMDAFVAQGYAFELEDLTRWSDRMVPHMQATDLWANEASSSQRSKQEDLMFEARRAWTEMPVFIRRRFFTKPEMDVVAFISVLTHCWDGETWQPFTKSRRYMDFPDARRLADRLIEVAAQTRMSV